VHVNEVAFANFNDGFSIEGTSTGTRVFNSIAIENGTKTNGYDLFVDSTSTVGLESNDNVLWNSGPQPPVRIANSVYPTVSGYSAGRAQDTRSTQADPRFADAANGDFQLTAGSPAIDDANSEAPDWSSTDAEGNPRVDDAGTPNRGLGPVTFADRGALEFTDSSTPTNQPPVARLTASPESGTAPLGVELSAAGSSDPDGSIVSYLFDFGDGASVGPQASATAKHTYAAGHWTAHVTVTDDGGTSASATARVDVVGPSSNLVGNPSFETGIDGWTAAGGASIQQASGGHTGSFSLLALAPLAGLSAYGISDLPDWVQHTGPVGTPYHVRAWVRAELGAGLVSLFLREVNMAGAATWNSEKLALESGWAEIDLDVITQFDDSRLDLMIRSAPSVLGTAFRIDDVSIVAGDVAPATTGVPGSGDDPFLAPGVHPNPVRASGARIVFAAAAGGPARIAVFDLAGRVVRELDGDPAAPPGTQSVVFDGRGDDGRRLPGGVYYYQVRTAGALTHGRLVIVE
jgi:hypothetical protein